jgi:15-cis-phytoene synthase
VFFLLPAYSIPWCPMPSTSHNADDASSDLQQCRLLLETGSRTFLAASRFLPREVADGACALYAFCRTADDIVDAPGSNRLAVEGMRDRLALIYLGRPRAIAADRAFARVIARYGIPRALPDALLEGFEWDAQGRRYSNLAELHDYAARVAGAVGAMMALIMGKGDAESLARACDLGVAMQLSNIARDVGEDARLGRLYLPLEWLAEQGIDADRFILNPAFDDRLAHVIERLLTEARMLYMRAAPGVARLPLSCRPAIEIARVLYAEIGNEVARRHYDSVASRAVVSRGRKVRVALRGLGGIAMRRHGPGVAPLDATRFLVEATHPHKPRCATESRARDGHAQWVFELFMRLEDRDHLGHNRRASSRSPLRQIASP